MLRHPPVDSAPPKIFMECRSTVVGWRTPAPSTTGSAGLRLPLFRRAPRGITGGGMATASGVLGKYALPCRDAEESVPMDARLRKGVRRPVAHLLGLLTAITLSAQQPELTEERVYGREAWILANGQIRVALLKGGGHIAEVRQTTGNPKRDVNPLRVPHYPTIEPQNYHPAKHGDIYGTDPHARLSSGYLGHLLCFPYYGPASDQEAQRGLGNHGEAPVVAWVKIRAEVTPASVGFEYGADLPQTHYRVRRKVTVLAGKREVTVEEWVENLTDLDRPMQWMQHATFGPPFVEPGRSRLKISAQDPALRDRLMSAQPRSGSYTAIRLDPTRDQQFFILSHPDFDVQIGYLLPTPQNPWVGDWMENQRSLTLPWNGQVIARGIEFGNSPYAEGLRKAIARASIDGTPTYGWIRARETLKNEYRIFLSEPGTAAPAH
ncbi:MAG: hypothetical protein RL077_6196 [Verrucomicrobiota bacterium]